jgi:hypothetical protein
MIGLLARVIIGAVVAGAAGAAGYAVYKLLTRDKVKEEINEILLEDQDPELFIKAFAAKVKMKQSESITVDILDEWDEPIATGMEVKGDEVSDEIHVGDIISLVD